ncbi:SDR family NAD(P)-dependent oxidoreductase [Paenibacillus lutrae]|uniref:SDR family NAD(P)-dependent oxidoreductase n=1 Tax=Paenibacillus lutrae TaxID=2078573 RepID=A0A7X3FFF3_9BACL|nr:SDR family NAD(P)-dependent oxidoreductase [Paenibacillus lutrae]
MIKKLLELDKNVIFAPDPHEFKIEDVATNDFAVIGMSGTVGKMNNLDEFWESLINGVDSIDELPAARKRDFNDVLSAVGLEDTGVMEVEGAYLSAIDKFDHQFFNISAAEARYLDPQQRLFLETVWHALEDAGYSGNRAVGSRTGIYVGYSESRPSYENLIWNAESMMNAAAKAGNISSIIASRMAYLMNFKGPCLLVDTACSSSLTAIHLACQALRAGEVEMAIAGGVKVVLLPAKVNANEEVGIASTDGRARTFDYYSDGTGSGEGVAAVLLKPLHKAVEDNDHIYAVIKGSMINNDGSSIGITAPNVLAQEDVLLRAWEDAGIHPETISYIEAHGTGTKLGDPIEIDGIRRAFKKYTDKKQFCAIGSVKTNVGHLDSAAGIISFIKAVLALHHKQIPPSIHFQRPNPKINLEDSPVYVQDKMTSWEPQSTPRRCGVSSFGLSGTNCHIVLEEAPEKNAVLSDSTSLFVISGATKASLDELIQTYIQYFEVHTELSLKDVCYTAGIGRKHLNHRLAIVASSVSELRDQLRQFAASGVSEGNRVWFKRHQLIDVNKTIKADGELWLEDKQQLTAQAQSVTDSCRISGCDQAEVLVQLALLYVEGADLQWASLFEQGTANSVPLPGYAFDKKRSWVQNRPDMARPPGLEAESAQGIRAGSAGPVPIRTKIGDLYLRAFSEKDWIIRDHQINGTGLLVGTAYLDMAVSAALHTNPDRSIKLLNVTLLSPFLIPTGQSKELQTLVQRQKDHRMTFSMASREDGSPPGWTDHAVGEMESVSPEDALVPSYSLEQIKNRCSKQLPGNIRQPERRSSLQLGERWFSLEQVYAGDNELLGYFVLPQRYQSEVAGHMAYPPLLDAALNIPDPAVNEKDTFIPFQFKEVIFHSPLKAVFYSYLRKVEETEGSITYDASIMDEQGKLLIEVRGYVLRKAALLPETEVPSAYYEFEWQPIKIGDSRKEWKPGSILVFNTAQGQGIAKQLRALGSSSVLEAVIGDSYERLDETTFRIRPDQRDITRLLAEVQDQKITRFVHAWSAADLDFGGLAVSGDRLELRLARGIYSLFHLTRALQRAYAGKPVLLDVLTLCGNKVTGREEKLIPEHAAIHALLNVMRQEMPDWHVRYMDMDESPESLETAAACMLSDSAAEVSFRSGLAYGKLMKEAAPGRHSDISIHSEGVYIITGGTGGAGLQMAAYLASKNRVQLALINRSRFPKREIWESLLQESSDEELIGKIKMIRQLEALGSAVSVYSADVSDHAQMTEVFHELKREFGKINGIIHTAGLPPSGLLPLIREDDFQAVLKPKVQGTRVLDELTASEEMDFVIYFSSITTFLGGVGQGDYAAANAYQEAYSEFRNQQGKRTIAIVWPAWIETGMAARHGVNLRDVFRPVTNEQAWEAMDRILTSGSGRVIVGPIQYSEIAGMDDLPFMLHTDIQLRLDREKQVSAVSAAESNSGVPVTITGRTDNRYSELEREMAKVWAEALGTDVIDIYDNFFNLGGDSIFAMKIVNAFGRKAEHQLQITDVLTHQSIYALTAYLEQSAGLIGESPDIGSETIVPSESRVYYPVTPSQKRIFFVQQMEGAGTAYNIPELLQIEGELDLQRVQKAVARVIERHSILRTSFEWAEGEIVQKINPAHEIELRQYEAADHEVPGIIQSFIRPFDLSKAPLLRCAVIKLASDRHILLFDFHHIVTDWTSYNVFVQDFGAFYEGIEPDPAVLQYADYAVWLKKHLSDSRMNAQEKYWLSVFNGNLPVLNLPTDFPRPQVRSFEGDRLAFEMDKELSGKLSLMAKKSGATLFMLLLALYSILLSKYSGQDDIVIGSAISGRRNKGIEHIIGMFVNMLAIRNRPQQELTFEQYLTEVRAQVLGAYESQDYPVEELIRKLPIPRDTGRNPLFDTVFIFENIEVRQMQLRDMSISAVDYDFPISKFDLSLYALEKETLHFSFEFSTKLFKKETIERMSAHFIHLAQQVSDHPDIRIADVELMTQQEKQRILSGLQVRHSDSGNNSRNEPGAEMLKLELDADFNF